MPGYFVRHKPHPSGDWTPQLAASVAEKYIDEIAVVLAQTFAGKEKEIADNMARIYCTEFNEQDIAELVTFYKSHARASRD